NNSFAFTQLHERFYLSKPPPLQSAISSPLTLCLRLQPQLRLLTVQLPSAMQLLLISLLLPSLVAAQSTMETTTKPMEATTTPNIGGFTSDQLGVLIGIPVALVIIIIIGVIIGCVVQHKVHQEDKLLEGKPYQDQGDVGTGGSQAMGRSPYYNDYLSQTKN
ncbi:hypothetical protein BOX15_Mlig031473g1, partial [Macrostomum lignano]